MEDFVEGDGEDKEGYTKPDRVNVRSFVSSRIKEIISLTEQLHDSQKGKQGTAKGFAFQHVSKHMRRRAVSHNPKRLPIRLRFAHIAQRASSDEAGNNTGKTKRPKTKHRSRLPRTVPEFNKRQLGNPLWLEGHVWHAKRFHMKSLWGRKVPFAPTAKCFRSLFSASRNRATMQDISYLTCLELIGSQQLLLNGLSKLMPFDTSPLSMESLAFNRELIGHIYSSSSFYIGPIRYLIVPLVSCLTAQCREVQKIKIIIWAHPAAKAHLVEELASVFKLVSEDVQDNPLAILPQNPNKEEQKYIWKLLLNKKWRNAASGVQLRDISGALNRIRLYGPKSMAVLKEMLKIAELPYDFGESGVNTDSATKEEQENVWRSITRITSVSNNTVVPLNVLDPRLNLPDKRRSVTVEQSTSLHPKHIADINEKIAKMRSKIWCEQARRYLLHVKMSDERLAKIRSENLIPGTKIEASPETNVVPIVLVFRSGSHSHGGSSSFVGIDLILPTGWLMPFWISLSYRCVRAYGIEFCDYLTFEEDPHSINDVTPSSFFAPDSVTHVHEEKKLQGELYSKYFAQPPAKRHNLLKLGCPFPFSLDWHRFMAFTFRDKNECLKLEDHHDKMEVDESTSHLHVIRCSSAVSRFLVDANLNKELPAKFKPTDLYPVTLTLVSGAIDDRACILLPTVEDLQSFYERKKKTRGVVANSNVVMQEKLPDLNESIRTNLTRQHHKRLALLRKKRKVARKAASEKDFDIASRLSELDSKSECEEFNKKLQKLWLYEDVDDALSKQCREPLGLITYAHYSFLRGKSGAVGYVPVGQLKKLVDVHAQCQDKLGGKGKREIYVLVRNWNKSLVCHWAKLVLNE